jgi:hypothetical protein
MDRRHIDVTQVREALRSDANAGLPDSEGRPAVAVFTLGADDTAWNPASTKPERAVLGPCKVTYRRYRDGATEATVRDV